MNGKVPLYKVVTNKLGKNYVNKYWVRPSDLIKKREKRRSDTKDIHTDSFGNYKPERKALHSVIVTQIVEACPFPKRGEKPKAILLMGGAASGKSTIVRNYLEPKYGIGAFGTLNSDEIKEHLPEYDSFLREDVEEAANRVHEESSDITKRSLSLIVNGKRNFIYDAVLGNPEKANKLIDDLYTNGYDIELVCVSLDTQTAWNRAFTRAIGHDGKEDGSGRYIPEEPFFRGHRGTVHSFQGFDRSKVKDHVLFDNNVPSGEHAILVIQNGKVKKPELFEKFKMKKDEQIDLRKSYSIDEYFTSFDSILKGFDLDLVDSPTFFKAKETMSDILKAIPLGAPVSFSDTHHESLSVNDLMDALADNSEFKNYCDAIVINEKGQILIIQRTSSDDFEPSKWCLPGGKAEQGEYLRAAVARELLEETGLVSKNCNYSTLYRNTDGSFSHYFYCYVEDLTTSILDAEEIQQYVWADLDDLGKYDFMFDLLERIKAIFNMPFKGKFLTEQELAALAVNKIEEKKPKSILGDYGDRVIDHLKELLDPKNQINKAHTETSLETSYTKGCLMLDAPDDLKSNWGAILDKIDFEDVYGEEGFGKEYNSHITILYGFELPTVTPEHIEKLLPESGVSFKITDVSYFDAPDYDVLKFGISSDQLHSLNSRYRSLPYENSFPDYKPHMTMAYLKKGCAEKYIEVLRDLVGRSFQSTEFDYSYNNQEGLKAKDHWDVKGYESIEKAFDNDEISTQEYFDLLKARKTYQIGEVSQSTGLKKVGPNKWVDSKTGKEVKADENGKPHDGSDKPVDITKLSNDELAEHAKNSSETELQTAIKENRDPRLRKIAHDEIERRGKEEIPKEEEKLNQKDLFPAERELIDKYTQAHYRKINRGLIKGDLDEEWKQKAETISQGLAKLPDFTGTVHRGFSPIKDLEEHLADFTNNIGGEIEFPSFTSTSIEKRNAEYFGTEMLFEIKSKSGKDITHLSNMKDEKEVLFDKGSKFKISKVKKTQKSGKILAFTVHLEQI